MSLFSLEDNAGDSVRIRVALHIINDVVPRILRFECITDRISLAYSWYRLLCKMGRCPDITENYLEWGEEELKKIADSLLDLARNLLGTYIG